MTGAGLILVTALIASGRDRPVDFDTEVIPILTRSGCNTGACHGAAIGRGGFKLSLLGGDPRVITRRSSTNWRAVGSIPPGPRRA